MVTHVESGLLRLRLLGLNVGASVVDPAVFQVFYGYETIQTGRDRRRTDRRAPDLSWTPEESLLL